MPKKPSNMYAVLKSEGMKQQPKPEQDKPSKCAPARKERKGYGR